MKNIIKKSTLAMLMTLLFLTIPAGCGQNIPSDAEMILNEASETQTESPAPSVSDNVLSVAEHEIIIIDEDEEIYIPIEEQEIDEEIDTPDPASSTLHIVFLGDDNLDNHRDKSGIANRIANLCDATVYNLAIAGSNVAFIKDDGYHTDGINSLNQKSLVGISRILSGKDSTSGIKNTRASEVLDMLKIEDADYIVISYNINDFYHRIPLDTEDHKGGTETYVGGYREAIKNLRKAAPYAKIIVCTPHFAQFFDPDGAFIGDAHNVSNGEGTLFDYKGKVDYIAKEQRTKHFNAFQDIKINAYSAHEMLVDGVHLSEAGRKRYAEYLAELINEREDRIFNNIR